LGMAKNALRKIYACLFKHESNVIKL
jgi:hypothetical protein